MAWTTPPTFVDGNLWSAAQLNILSDDLNELWGLAQGPNTPFLSLYSQGISLTSENNLQYFRYQLPYLHYKARCIDYGVVSFTIYINGVSAYSDATDYTGAHTYTGYINLSGRGLTIGRSGQAPNFPASATSNTTRLKRHLLCRRMGSSRAGRTPSSSKPRRIRCRSRRQSTARAAP